MASLAVLGLFDNSGTGRPWKRFPLKGLSVPDATKPQCTLADSPRGNLTQPPRHHKHTCRMPSLSGPAIGSISKVFCSGIGVLFHNYAKSVFYTPTLLVWEQATEVSVTLQFQTGVEGRSLCWYRGTV